MPGLYDYQHREDHNGEKDESFLFQVLSVCFSPMNVVIIDPAKT